MKHWKSFTLTFILIILSNLYVVAQKEPQTYKGSYELNGKVGDVEYQYYNHAFNNERVFHGFFKFTSNEYLSLNREGNYKNGLKHGKWIFGTEGRALTTAYYNEGKLNGLFESKVWGRNTIVVQYKDNHFTGSFDFTDGVNHYTGQFDDDGYATGEWLQKRVRDGILFTRRQKWDKGILLSYIEIDESTGKQKDMLTQIHSHPSPYVIQEERHKLFREVKAHPIMDFFWTTNKRNEPVQQGLRNGEYPMSIDPMRGTYTEADRKKDELQRREQEKIEREKKKQAEIEHKEKEELELTYKKTIEDLSNTGYCKLLTELNKNKENGNSFARNKTIIVSECINKIAKAEIKQVNYTKEQLSNPIILIIPIEFVLVDNIWTVNQTISIIDNSKDKCLTGINIEEGVFYYDNGNSLLANVNSKLFECGDLIISKHKDKQLLITKRVGNKTKTIVVKDIAFEKNIKNAVCYRLSETKFSPKSYIDPLLITEEEISLSAEEIYKKQLQNKYPK